ncbi:MAG: hypothetical protein AAFR38_01375 [Planctomycetota bacterium]
MHGKPLTAAMLRASAQAKALVISGDPEMTLGGIRTLAAERGKSSRAVASDLLTLLAVDFAAARSLMKELARSKQIHERWVALDALRVAHGSEFYDRSLEELLRRGGPTLLEAMIKPVCERGPALLEAVRAALDAATAGERRAQLEGMIKLIETGWWLRDVSGVDPRVRAGPVQLYIAFETAGGRRVRYEIVEADDFDERGAEALISEAVELARRTERTPEQELREFKATHRIFGRDALPIDDFRFWTELGFFTRSFAHTYFDAVDDRDAISPDRARYEARKTAEKAKA